MVKGKSVQHSDARRVLCGELVIDLTYGGGNAADDSQPRVDRFPEELSFLLDEL